MFGAGSYQMCIFLDAAGNDLSYPFRVNDFIRPEIMPVSIRNRSVTSNDLAKIFSGEKNANAVLTFWDRFKDLFRKDTKRDAVEACIRAIASPAMPPASQSEVLDKWKKFDRLIDLAKEADQRRFRIHLSEPEDSGGGTIVSWKMQFIVNDELLHEESHSETAGLHTDAGYRFLTR